MKKLFFVFVVLFSALFFSCASSSIVSKEYSFITEYDDIRNVTFITH